jgi:pantetheine-phosphate adenylyltransferase
LSTSPERAGALAVYPGSFDPMTCGHLEIVERSARIFEHVIVAVGRHPSKPGHFSVAERVELVSRCISHLRNAEATFFEGLVVDFCRSRGARVLIRGLRATSDFEPEFQMGLANRDLAPEIETVFLIPRPEQQFVSSSLVREIAGHGGRFEPYVPAPIAAAMHAKRAAAARGGAT